MTTPYTLRQPEAETWGEALRRHIMRHGNLQAIVADLRDATRDPVLGQRNAFAELFKYERPPTSPRDRYRATLLLLALGFDPKPWGLSTDDLPRAYADADTLAGLLSRRSGWTRAEGAGS